MAAGGGGGKGGSSQSGGGGNSKDKAKDKSGTNENGTQSRDPAGPNGATDGGSGVGGGGKPGGGTGNGGKGGGGATGPKPGTGYVDAIDDPVAKKNQEVNADATDEGEAGWFDSWGSFWDHVAKLGGAGVGIGEREQTFTETAMDMANGAPPADGDPTNDAHWGWDPAVALGNVAGSVVGGLGGGTIVGGVVDAISNELGRPFDIDLGTDPLGSGSPTSGTSSDAPSGGSQDPNTGGDAGAGDPGGGGGNDNQGNFGSVIAKPPVKKPTTTPDTEQNTGGLPSTTPTEGLGIDVLTQTSGSSTDVNIRTPEQRRRRGSLGGLGLGGLGI